METKSAPEPPTYIIPPPTLVTVPRHLSIAERYVLEALIFMERDHRENTSAEAIRDVLKYTGAATPQVSDISSRLRNLTSLGLIGEVDVPGRLVRRATAEGIAQCPQLELTFKAPAKNIYSDLHTRSAFEDLPMGDREVAGIILSTLASLRDTRVYPITLERILKGAAEIVNGITVFYGGVERVCQKLCDLRRIETAPGPMKVYRLMPGWDLPSGNRTLLATYLRTKCSVSALDVDVLMAIADAAARLQCSDSEAVVSTAEIVLVLQGEFYGWTGADRVKIGGPLSRLVDRGYISWHVRGNEVKLLDGWDMISEDVDEEIDEEDPDRDEEDEEPDDDE